MFQVVLRAVGTGGSRRGGDRAGGGRPSRAHRPIGCWVGVATPGLRNVASQIPDLCLDCFLAQTSKHTRLKQQLQLLQHAHARRMHVETTLVADRAAEAGLGSLGELELNWIWTFFFFQFNLFTHRRVCIPVNPAGSCGLRPA